MSEDSKKVLLKVEHLEQYFKLGNKKTLKAVDDINFEIYDGEVFGLVGESGCGKTTTGRSIIKLYNITGGSIYFDGYRISAGIRTYKQTIKDAKKDYNSKVKELNLKLKDESISLEEKQKIEATKQELGINLSNIIKDNTQKIKSALYDNKNCNKDFAKNSVLKLNNEYKDKFNELDDESKKDIEIKDNDYISAYKQFITNSYNKTIQEYKKNIFDIDSKLKDESLEADKRKEFEVIKQDYDEKLLQAKDEYSLKIKEINKELKSAKDDKITNKMQMIFQDPISSLDPRMTVHDIIAEGLVVRGIKDKKFIEQEVFRVLRLVGLVPEHAGRYPHEFSGGQRQRIGIARAIILNPKMIIADEPISALDVSIQAQVINLLNDIREQMGLTILFIAHDLSVVKYFSDRIAVMYYGKIVEIAESDELFKNPLHPYTRSLLSAIPLPDPHYEKKRKRVTYNPIAEHDYSVDKPSMREIKEGHFIYCNDQEFEKYKTMLK